MGSTRPNRPLSVLASGSSPLERDLRATVKGDVRFDRLARTLYSTDASLYQIEPVGVVVPRDADDVVRTLNVARRHHTPLIPRGAGTGIAGGAVGAGLQVDLTKHLTQISDFDPTARTVRVQPGVVLDDLNEFLRQHDLLLPVDVATGSRATIGGMIANNSCGAHSVMFGRMVDYVAELTVLLADGSVQTWPHLPYDELPALNGRAPQVPWGRPPRLAGRRRTRQTGPENEWLEQLPRAIRDCLANVRESMRAEALEKYPRVLRRNGGYALDRLCMSADVNPATLVIGSEGTLAIVLEAQLRLVPRPKFSALLIVQFDSVLDAVGATPRILQHSPAAVELIDRRILEPGAAELPSGVRARLLHGMPEAVLVCSLMENDRARLLSRLERLEQDLAATNTGTHRTPVLNRADQDCVWEMRKRGFGLLMSTPGPRQPHEFIEDAAVDPQDLRAYIEAVGDMLREEGAPDVAYYAHASVGVIHVRPVLNLSKPAEVHRLARIAERTADLVLRFGGAFTGEHGDGLVRSWSLERMYGPRIIDAFGQVKRAFDPENRFNPGKIVDPQPITANLRYARPPREPEFETHLDFDAHGGLHGMAAMCSGVGQCRQKLVGTMCPSYMATLDERHTTRARANALRNALEEGGLIDGLKDPALDEVMGLCISCKACKTECPTGVDMARLKSEWLAYRNQTRGTPRRAKFVARAPGWTRWAAIAPGFANAIMKRPMIRWLLERMYGLDARVAPPTLALRTFAEWAARREAPPGERESVVYVADTWTNYYWPEAGIAAVRLLEAAGYEVIVPKLGCCGRPAISKGMLNDARRMADYNIACLEAFAEADIPILGSEPSCILTFKDEWPQLVRTDAAQAVANVTRTVEEFLAAELEKDPQRLKWTAPPAKRPLLYHGHCHQKAIVGTEAVHALFRAHPGWEFGEINSGCCGMAGSFGHEAEHYEVSRAIGAQRLFPAVRARGDAEVVVSGFSCREQLTHHCGVSPRHVLEALAEGLVEEA
jgi:FAD/FMN-containing dehydrogenase/Fe-S oxidoreductase